MSMTQEQAEARLKPGRMLIGGEWIDSASGGEFVHVNPATGREHPPIPMGGATEVDQAVAAARAAFPAWRSMPRNQRRDILLRLAQLIKENADELGVLTTLDNGSVHRTSGSGTDAAYDNFTYYAGWVDKLGGDYIPTWPAPGLDYTVSEPYGVVAVIIPWNAMMHNVGQVIAPALAAGNCVLFKPPELAPFAVLRFAELAVEAGIPAGVLNVVPGGPESGAAMVAHPGIDKVHFIGSGNTAKQIMKSAADTLKPLTFELGGKSANILFEDADLQSAVGFSTFFAMANAGQGCLLPTRLLVQDSIYDQVLAMMEGMAPFLKVGDPFAEDTMVGPVITETACERILSTIERAKADGDGRILTGGGRAGGDLANGFFVEPTIFVDVDNSSSLAQNEVFGPVLAVIRFSDEEEAVRIANDTQYGLMAYAFTNDLKRAHRVADQLEAGQIFLNGFAGLPIGAPFGGVKQSGFGRMGGRPGLEEFLRPKNVYVPLA